MPNRCSKKALIRKTARIKLRESLCSTAPKEAEVGAQARPDPDPPCARHAGNPDPCPTIVVTGHATPTCELGFDWDEESDSCVPNFVGEGTTTPGATPGNGTPGSSAAGGPNDNDDDDDDNEDDEEEEEEDEDEEEPACTDDQIAIAAEYESHRIEGEWPCEIFEHIIVERDKYGNPNTGVDGHQLGYLSQGYITGSTEVLRIVADEGLTGYGIETDWRCPDGNAALPNAVPGSQHVRGTAGDFYADDFDSEVHAVYERAGIEAGAGWMKEYKNHTHIDWRGLP